jgi:hypothetical protein
VRSSDLRPPIAATDIDARWLSEALQERHPGADVERVEVVHAAEVTNSHARLAVTYRNDAGAPPSMFCKLLPRDERRTSIAATLMGPKEVRFYRDLAPSLPLRVPELHVGIHDATDDSFVLLLEDLTASGCEVSDGTRGVRTSEASSVLEDLAHLHARFENPERRAAEAPWVTERGFGSTYGSLMLQYGLDNHRDRLSDSFAAISGVYIDSGEALHELWTAGPKTIIHGDPHIGNVFFDAGEVGFLDWGIINVNTPMRDVSYFMNMAMDIDDRRADQESLLRHYLDVRRSLGAIPITWDEAWSEHRIHGSYCVVASCQVVMFPEDATPQRRIHADAFLQRAEAAIEDLDSLAAIREAANL